MFTLLTAQAIELRHTAHIAFAPGCDAVADPMFFRHDFAIQFLEVFFLFFEQRIAPLLKG